MKEVTIMDIARMAGVSKTTVSRVINDNGYVSKENKDRILAIIKDCDYQPLAMARDLNKKQSSMIGVVIPSAENEFFGQILEGISEVADEKGYFVVSCTTNNNPQREKKALQLFRGQRIKGLLITPAAGYLDANGWRYLHSAIDDLGVPVVLIDRGVKNASWDGVYFDNFNGAYIATESLIKKGHSRIGCIVSDMSLQLGFDRYNGFVHAMQDNGLSVDPTCVVQDKQMITKELAYAMAKRLIHENKPQAFFLSNGIIASGFFKAILEENLWPGKDMDCSGFDAIEIADILHLSYDYLDRDAVNMGRIAMQMLIDQFDSTIASRREYIIPAKLITSVARTPQRRQPIKV